MRIKLRDILIASGLIIIAFIIYAALTYAPEEQVAKTPENFSFSVKEIGRAGDYAYAVFALNGGANITLVGYNVSAPLRITVINDPEGVDSLRIPELAEKIKPIERYGYTVKLSDKRMMTDDINVVATGAMPNYILDAIKANATKGVVVYIGRSDWVIRGGSIINENWYDELSDEQKQRVLMYNGTVATFLDNKMEGKMVDDILKNKWAYETSENYFVSANETTTRVLKINNSQYLRIIYELGKASGVVDSKRLPERPDIILKPEPEEIYPWQSARLTYKIEKSNGTVYLYTYKDGVEGRTERLKRVVEGSYFSETITQKDSGYYIFILKDNSGVIGSGILHVKNLEIKFSKRVYNSYYFNVTVDGEPLKSATVNVSLNDGGSRKFYVKDGELVVNALLKKKGENVFNLYVEGKRFDITVINEQQSVWDVYITYGLPGLFLVGIIYLFARLNVRPVYTIRISEGGAEIRDEIRVKEEEVLDAIRKIKRDAKLGDYPITIGEFEVALKRYLTYDAEVTEGNIEEILQKLVKKGKIENYKDYYDIASGNIKEKALLREIKEDLIEAGIPFKEIKGGFSTKDYDVVLAGYGTGEKKTIVVFENEQKIKEFEKSLSEMERVKMKIKIANNLLVLATIDKLPRYL
jgi:hypothetical protein